MGNYASALQDYDRCIALDPEDGNHYYWRAYLLTDFLERHEDALKDINRSLELNSSDPNNYWPRSRIWENLGEPEKAATDLKTFQELESAKN